MKKREYNRCKTACSTPPIYWSTGIQYSAALRSNATGARAEQNRRKYQDDSKNVSNVSVSRVAGLLQYGQLTCFHVGWWSSGLPGLSNETSRGSSTGRSSSGTGTMPQSGQWMTGIGQPQ